MSKLIFLLLVTLLALTTVSAQSDWTGSGTILSPDGGGLGFGGGNSYNSYNSYNRGGYSPYNNYGFFG
ncbi:unnamed protein product [Bursaphelenchus okinawaensis]|uniref:Uncharacterized protein n=1 Tax=Bursaphelenchus okinawaensis TaxID=465554 RepID=A0A811K1J3_9BILA|nr:unnamed protein product [Bursaphelenchus okinawaensis]CAG9088962.1 unnamed protein product [Bursaphelenchus okinawaensis]